MAINPTVGAAGIAAGGDLLTSLASAIFSSRDTGRLKRLAEYLRSRLGQSAISPAEQEGIVTRNQAAMAPQLNQYAEGLNRRLNLDSGVAQGVLADRIFPTQMALRNDLSMKNLEMTNQNDAQIRALLAQLESSIAG